MNSFLATLKSHLEQNSMAVEANHILLKSNKLQCPSEEKKEVVRLHYLKQMAKTYKWIK